MSRNLTADGRPVCGAGCRWPRGECPTHPMPSFKHRNVPYGTLAGVAVLRVSHAVKRDVSGMSPTANFDATCGGCGYHVCACAAKAPARKPGEFVVGDVLEVVCPRKLEVFPGLKGLPVRVTRVNNRYVYFEAFDHVGDNCFNFVASRFKLVEAAPPPRATAG